MTSGGSSATTTVHGRLRPAAIGLARLVAAWSPPPRPDDPAWTDAEGTLTYRELAQAAAPWRRRDRAAEVVCETRPRELAVKIVAGLLDARPLLIVSGRAGDAARRAAEQAALRTSGRWRPFDVTFTTSGTTGTARPVRSRRRPTAGLQTLGALGTLPGPEHWAARRPVVACLAPIDHGHGFGVWAATAALGGHFLALDARRAVAQLAAQPHVDLLSGVPVQLADLCDALTRDPQRTLRVANVLAGSDRLTPDLAERLTALLGAAVGNAYGSTETGTVCVATPADRRIDPSTVGRPLPGCSVTVHDGRLVVRSPLLAGDQFGSDAGWIGADGLVRVSGRADGVRVSGGENSNADAVRAWVLDRPGVLSARWSTRPDARFGMRPVAAVEVDGCFVGSADDLRAAITAEFGAATTPAELTLVRR